MPTKGATRAANTMAAGCLFATVLLAAPLLGETKAQSVPQPKPHWEADLTKYGYQGRPPVELRNEDNWGYWTYQQGVVFTGLNTVAAFFVIRDLPEAERVQRKASPADPYRLVAVFLSADRGELVRKLDWPLPPDSEDVSQSFFFPATNGRFLVGIGNTLMLYSADFEPLARHVSAGELSAASPAGDFVLLHQTQEVGGDWVTRFDLVETEKLTVVKSWKGEDHSQAVWGDMRAIWSQDGLRLQVADSAPRAVLGERKELCGYYSFLREDVIAAVECRAGERLLVFSTSGQILQELDLDLEQQDGPAVASRDGRRFAFPTREWGSSSFTPKRLIARVFNVGGKEPLMTLDVPRRFGTGKHFGTERGDTRFGWGGLALSDDGGLLAVKSGHLVQLYQVPERGLESQSTTVSASEPSREALPSYGPPSELARQALSWLPADTETVVVAQGPFNLPRHWSDEEEHTEREPKDIFESLPFLLFANKLLHKHLQGESVLLGMEGSRRFGSPSGLGLGPFEGCAIGMFANDITARAHSFLNDATKVAARVDVIEGHSVAVFEEKWENDTWNIYVAFPKPNVAVAASDEKYLREVLVRMNGKSSPRALPEGLPEWRHLNARARFWGLRHYDKAGSASDPTNPMGGRKPANRQDEYAVGFVFQFDPSASKIASVRYISGHPNLLDHAQKNLFPMEREPGFRQLGVKYRQVAPGVVEGSYDLSRIQPAKLFMFVLMIMLGHAVYV